MTNEELQEQFSLCEKWNDPEQWELLAVAYFQRGYDLNALVCFNRADACRMYMPVKVDGETDLVVN
jgi:hypothetical protein